MELLRVVRRRWLWLLAGLFVGIIASVVHLSLTAPLYESSASIRIGKVHGVGIIEDINSLVFQLNDKHGSGPDSDVKRMGSLKRVTKISEQDLSLLASGSSPEQVRDFLIQVTTELTQRHEQIYKSAIDPIQRQLEMIDNQIELLTSQIAGLGKSIIPLKESYPALASVIAMERSRLYSQLYQLEYEQWTLQRQIVKPYSLSSEIIRPPTLPERPISPKKTTSVAAGIAAGLILGLLTAYVRELLGNARG